MDKLRAIEYFAAASRMGSFSAAARALDVTVAAVTKGVAALEAQVGAKLLERRPTGVATTDEGANYLAHCTEVLERLTLAEEQLQQRGGVVEGSVVLATNNVIARHVISPHLSEFRARFPRVQLVLRDFGGKRADEYEGVDVFITTDWTRHPDLVQRPLLQAEFWVVASPRYWSQRGVPSHPNNLKTHDALLLAANSGTVMDMWRFVRGDEICSVVMNGPLIVSNAHRDSLLDAALEGHGIVRTLDWAVRADVQSGRLVRVLSDWDATEAPPTHILYPSRSRSIPRTRAVIDYFSAAIAAMNPRADKPVKINERPQWGWQGYQRSSQHLARVKE